MKRILYIALTAIAGISISSCTKVIDVNLNNTKPVIVIEGEITDTTGPYKVKITKTIDIDKNNNFPGVSGAVVTIADDAGNSETLVDMGSGGIYETRTLQGTPGRTYTLTVVVEGTTYKATSTMPAKVAYDSLGYKEVNTPDGKEPYPTVYYRDPETKGNYYRAKQYVNGVFDGEIFVESDEFIDGKNRAAILFNGPRDDEDKIINIVGEVTVEMQCIDKKNFEYLEQLVEASGNPQSATPANPVTNISNGALGYFSAHTSSFKKLPALTLLQL
ncbi:MAG: DUF4249 family protein [Flavipsychrobacter sp.]